MYAEDKNDPQRVNSTAALCLVVDVLDGVPTTKNMKYVINIFNKCLNPENINNKESQVIYNEVLPFSADVYSWS